MPGCRNDRLHVPDMDTAMNQWRPVRGYCMWVMLFCVRVRRCRRVQESESLGGVRGALPAARPRAHGRVRP